MQCAAVGCTRSLASVWINAFPGLDKCPDHAVAAGLCQRCKRCGWRIVPRARANAAMFTCDDCSSEEEKTKAEAPYAGHVEPPKKPITETAAWKDHLPDQP